MQLHAMQADQIASYKGTAMGTEITLHRHVWDVTKQGLHHVPANVTPNGVSHTIACTNTTDQGSMSAKTVTGQTIQAFMQDRQACTHACLRFCQQC